MLMQCLHKLDTLKDQWERERWIERGRKIWTERAESVWCYLEQQLALLYMSLHILYGAFGGQRENYWIKLYIWLIDPIYVRKTSILVILNTARHGWSDGRSPHFRNDLHYYLNEDFINANSTVHSLLQFEQHLNKLSWEREIRAAVQA